MNFSYWRWQRKH